MAQLSRAALISFFETGDKPEGFEFADLIDSIPNFVDDGIGVWEKFTFDYTAFQPNPGPSGFITIKNVPARSILSNAQIKHSIAWSGGPIIGASLSLYEITQDVQFTISANVFVPPANTGGASGRAASNAIFDFNNPYDISLAILVIGGVINDLTQGTVDVWIKVDQLPA